MPDGKKITTGGFFRMAFGSGLDAIQESSIPQGEAGDVARDVLRATKEKLDAQENYVDDNTIKTGGEVIDAEFEEKDEDE